MTYSCKFCGLVFESPRKVAGHQAGKHMKGLGLKNSTIQVDDLSDYQLGYLAAFLDGEGGIQITYNERKDRLYTTALHPTVYFTNTNREVIETLKSWLRAGCIVVAKAREGCKPTFVLHVTGTKNIIVLLERLRPLMIIKTKQADVMLEYCRSRASHYRGKERRYTERELELYTTLKKLNERGVKSTPTHGSLTKAGKSQTGNLESEARLRKLKASHTKARYLK